MHSFIKMTLTWLVKTVLGAISLAVENIRSKLAAGVSASYFVFMQCDTWHADTDGTIY